MHAAMHRKCSSVLLPPIHSSHCSNWLPRSHPNFNNTLYKLFSTLIEGWNQTCLAQLSSEGCHPSTNGNKCTDQPNTRQYQGNPAEEVKERLQNHRDLGHYKNTVHRISWAGLIGTHRNLSNKHGPCMHLSLFLHIYLMVVA